MLILLQLPNLGKVDGKCSAITRRLDFVLRSVFKVRMLSPGTLAAEIINTSLVKTVDTNIRVI